MSPSRLLAPVSLGLVMLCMGCSPIVDPFPPTGAPADSLQPGAPGEGPREGETEKGEARDAVFLNERGVILEGSPPAPYLTLVGNLPTPCHELQVTVAPPDEQNRIEVRAASSADPDAVCIQVLAPLDEKVPLGEYAPGAYTVRLNGEEIGEFTIP